ncbi:MAG TPA: HEAT repeat domain-containing protein [Tepidisphaeraceae bacterium]|nr:HEAT repeat domain-containing protein [Tepidisphaeraceae bacterium]
MALLFCGCAQIDHAGTFVKREYNILTGKSPLNAAKQMEDQYFPDERRIGIVRLSDEDFGRRPPYTKRYEQIAQFDPDWLVRANAIRALNRSRDADATPIFIKALTDDNDLVRTEAAKALNNIPDENAVSTLLKVVTDTNQSRDTRIWSAAALKHYKTLEVARTLASQLGGREFGVAWQSRKSLVAITGKDLHYDEGAWLDYLTGPEKPFG